MLRPCIIKDISESPFDACIAEVFKDSEDLEAYILLREEKNRMCLFKHYVKCNSIEELDSMYNSWVCSLADALNAPVLATEEVLAGLPKDAKVYTIDEKTGDALKCTFDEQWGWVCGTGHFNEALELGRPYRIFTINDPKTEDYLRQFTLEGVRRVG